LILFLINSNDKNPFAALYVNNEVIVSYASEFIENPKPFNKKPDKLINCVHRISKEYSLNDIDAIAVTIGPGSFTGIRVGLSIAKGMAFGLDKKIIPVNNFDLTLYRVEDTQPDKKYCVLIEAKLPEYYYSIIENNMHLKNGCVEMSDLSAQIENESIIVGDFDNETSIKHSYFKFINVRSGSELDEMLDLSLKKIGNNYFF
jgi:tRNA threonylcarbamoyl adenosine modification protein YeaZ